MRMTRKKFVQPFRRCARPPKEHIGVQFADGVVREQWAIEWDQKHGGSDSGDGSKGIVNGVAPNSGIHLWKQTRYMNRYKIRFGELNEEWHQHSHSLIHVTRTQTHTNSHTNRRTVKSQYTKISLFIFISCKMFTMNLPGSLNAKELM